MSRLRRAGWALLPPLAAFAAYLPSLGHGFLAWDDALNLARNAQALGGGPLRVFASCGLGTYAPLDLLSRGLDNFIWGADPGGHHLTSALLHAAAALLCYFAALALLRAARAEDPAGEPGLRPAAAAAALFFGLHPLRAESVSWLSARHDLLCAAFLLAALPLYLRSRPAAGGAPARAQAAPLALYLGALLSKGMAVTFPAALLLLDVYPLRRLPGDPRRWAAPEYRGVLLEKMPYVLPAVLFAGVNWGCQAAAGSLAEPLGGGLGARLGTAAYGAVLYAFKTLLPYGLSPFYQLPAGFTLLSPAGAFYGAAAAGLTWAAWHWRRRLPAAAAAWFYYLLTLAPVSGLVKLNMQSAADRYSYLSCLGFAVLFGAGLRRALALHGGRRRAAAALAAGLWLALLAALAVRQQGFWADTEKLWRRALAVNPGIELVHNNLGHILAARGDHGGAELHYREAVRLRPASFLAHYNLGGLLAAAGRFEEARGHTQEAARLNPAFAPAHYNLGYIAGAQRDWPEAAGHYAAAAAADPGYAMAHYNRAIALESAGDRGGAEAAYRAALEVKADFAEARGNLAALLAARGLAAEAEKEYRQALAAAPGLATAHNNLAALLEARGDRAGALRHYLLAAATPGFAPACANLRRLGAGPPPGCRP